MYLTEIKGIGDKTASLFLKLKIENTGQLIHYYPRDYDFYKKTVSIGSCTGGEFVSICGVVTGVVNNRYVRGLSITQFMVSDGNGEVRLTYFNMPYLKKSLKSGSTYVFRGIFQKKGNSCVMDQPKIYKPEEYAKLEGTLQPIYSTTRGLSSQTILKTVNKALVAELGKTAALDPIPPYLLTKRGFTSLEDAIRTMHFPANMDHLMAARRRLVYQEFLLFLYQLRAGREEEAVVPNSHPMVPVAETTRLMEALPYRLTEDQVKAFTEIQEDLSGPFCMNRLVQGDVGSGKTILAILALLCCAANGYQGALMAPTEVLAMQHYKQIVELTTRYNLPIRPILLTGSMKVSEKKAAYREIEEGTVNVVIGTHALIQEKVAYKALALVITDEQHRFGVKQRMALAQKGEIPHILVMSATPIPRTLALILYGDLKVSLIKQLPANRLPIKNCVVDPGYLPKAYEFIRRQVSEGHQVYVICPMVEEGEMPELENVIDYAKKLKSALGDTIQVAYLHGKMKQAEKNRIMDEYAVGNIQVLVSTTVIEVGVNVPNATLMMVENAERFGLAQLHQLRGRVGRGDAQSYCIFLYHGQDQRVVDRLKILEQSNDGFHIAEEDMKRRGPGDLFGVRQSGGPEFTLADIYQDADVLKMADQDLDEIMHLSVSERANILSNFDRYIVQNQENQVDFRSI